LKQKLESWSDKIKADTQYAAVLKAVEGLIDRLHKVIEDPPKVLEVGIRSDPPEVFPILPVEEGQGSHRYYGLGIISYVLTWVL
jgi:hypothetical protein